MLIFLGCYEAKVIFLGCVKYPWTESHYVYVLSALESVTSHHLSLRTSTFWQVSSIAITTMKQAVLSGGPTNKFSHFGYIKKNSILENQNHSTKFHAILIKFQKILNETNNYQKG